METPSGPALGGEHDAKYEATVLIMRQAGIGWEHDPIRAFFPGVTEIIVIEAGDTATIMPVTRAGQEHAFIARSALKAIPGWTVETGIATAEVIAQASVPESLGLLAQRYLAMADAMADLEVEVEMVPG